VLLIGPPGTGKTLLARAVAGEAGVPFFSMSGSEFIEMVVGVGASRVRDLFSEARKAAPAIIFVDELDAIGRKRGGANVIGGNDEREQTLNQLLIEMDGFDSREAVIVLGATNRSDVLDPALLRPGRFDRRVTVQPPDRHGRAEILRVHTRGVPLDPSLDLNQIAAETPGLVGADLRNLVNEAALLAARKDQTTVTADDFAEALEKIALGAERRLAIQPEERRRVAYHESGHALLGLLQPEGDPVRRVTVVPRGQALGVTLSVPEDDRYNYSEPYLRARIVNALGGRAAEQIVYGVVTTGAENDIKQVTDLARAMVTRWGMSPEVGLLALVGREEGNYLDNGIGAGSARPYSDETAELIDNATRRIVDECYAKALDLLISNRDRLEALTEALLREESLNEAQMRDAAGLYDRVVPQREIVVVET
jgi:cell division protease FtsH